MRRQRKKKIIYAKKLRKRMTHAERFLWKIIRDRRFCGYKFRRQVPLGPFVADFCCKERYLIIELDGEIHQDQKEYDDERTKKLEEWGYRVLRFTNEEVIEQIGNVLREMKNFLDQLHP